MSFQRCEDSLTWKYLASHFDPRALCVHARNTFTTPSMYALASNALSAKAAAASRRSPTGDPRASSRTSADGALFAFRASVPGKKRTRAIVASASKYDMRPVDFTATQKPAAVTSYGRASRRTNDRDFVPSNAREHLTSYGDSATWIEGDCEVTLFSWRDAADRLRLVNRTLDACITDATQECSVTPDGEMCGVAIEKAMLILANEAVEIDEAVAALGVVLRAAGPDAAEACDAWCWRQAGTENEPRARTFARVAARTTFDYYTSDNTSSASSAQKTTNDLFVNNAVASYLRDVREECPVFHGADGACADVVDAALLMTACANVDEKEAMRVVDAILDAGEDAAMRAVQAWCVANPGAKHVDAVAKRVADAALNGTKPMEV